MQTLLETSVCKMDSGVFLIDTIISLSFDKTSVMIIIVSIFF